MRFEPRDYQRRGAALLADSHNRLLVAPMGSGKGTIAALALEADPELVVSVPNLGIAAGILRSWTGEDLFSCTEAKIRKATEGRRIYTDKVLVRKLQSLRPSAIVFDEGHHGIDQTHRMMHDLTGGRPIKALTATGFRATPEETKELHKLFGPPIPLISMRDCIDQGYVTLPTCDVVPLFDDETVDVVNGEFTVTSATKGFLSRLGALTDYLKSVPLDRPTTVVVPSVAAIDAIMPLFPGSFSVTATTSMAERGRIFEKTLRCEGLLFQIRAVGEGTDIPLRRMIDISPSMSPVLWMQRFGRIMRPGGGSEYLCLCHNLLRHGYLLDGVVPSSAFKRARDAWGEEWRPSRRMMTRALGLSGIGRFDPTEVDLTNGEVAWLYAIKEKRGLASYAALQLPGAPEVYYYQRDDAHTGKEKTFTTPDGHLVRYKEKAYGKWSRIDKLPEIKDCASYPEEFVGPAHRDFWLNQAARYGLVPVEDVTSKQAVLLSILKDTRSALQ